MDDSKPKSNPKKVKDVQKKRKVSLPISKTQSRIAIDELRQNFKRQISLPKERDIIPLYDPTEKAQESVSHVQKKTGIIYDETTKEHFCLWDENYPENPERLDCILKRCKELDLFSECETLSPVPVTRDQILTVHTKVHYNRLEQSQHEKNIEALKRLSSQYDSIYINQKTFDAAIASAGCCLELTKAVLEGKVQNGMAFVRPPGHHAMADEFCGYCFFNNAAIAANYALEKVQKILIVDWDVHHGQGTQKLFYDDPRVLYFSSHRYENGKFWPNLRESDFDYCGAGGGRGFTINVPLNETGMGNTEYLAFFHQVLLPIAYEFSPELVIVSGGFDCTIGDQKGMMTVTPPMFAHLTSALMSLARGKVAVFLEGGYCPASLSESAMHTLRTLMGRPCPRLMDAIGPPCQSICNTILSVISAQRPYWRCLWFQATHKNGTTSPTKSSDDSASDDDLEKEALHKFTPKAVFEGPPLSPPGTTFPIVDCYPEYSAEKAKSLGKELQRLKEGTDLGYAAAKLSFVYDPDMEKHLNVVNKSFPERPARTKEIFKKLTDFGILRRVLHLPSRRAVRSELRLVHDDELIDLMLNLANMTPRERNALATDYNSIYFNEYTWDSARLSTGCLLQVVDAVCTNQSQSGLALIRPPGHHAEHTEPNGFCFFNNICIAAKYAIQKYSLKRILILDWDVHHGNGVQHCFESSSSVLYISIHVYKDGNFFPYSIEANSNYVGKGDGRGFNINIPWSKNGMGDADYISAFTQIVLPVSYQFDPDLVLVSAGFDAAVNDPLGGCCVTPECFAHLTHMLSSLANGKVILALEGGYNLISISYCMTMCAKALLGDPLPPLSQKLVPSQSAVKTISEVIGFHKTFWSCLKFQVSLPKSETEDTFVLSQTAKEANSDSEFLTPPQSPPDVNLQDSATGGAAVGGTVLGKEPKSLESLFSKMALSDTAPKNEPADAGPLEGAVGTDTLTQMTIAQMLQEDSQLHAVVPLPWCPHLGEVNPIPGSGIDVIGARCLLCQDTKENWLCLTCYTVLCGRYVREHMVEHGLKESHNIVLSFSDLSVWCYTCESYVHNEVLNPAKQAAYFSKFGEVMML